MSELLAQLAVSNLVASFFLATLAHAVDRSGRHPAMAHGLWVLVLVKVLIPPLVMLPVIPAAQRPVGAGPHVHVGAWAGDVPSLLGQVIPGLLLGWAVGSILVLVISLIRVRRFDGLLRRTSRQASLAVRDLAADVAAELGLRATPTIQVTSARISPLTWWTGGPVHVVIPAALSDRLDAGGLRWVLAHELCHVKRRDHVVRWLEWLACVAFWWNPVVWWARRSLRLDEEASCDQLVVERLGGRPHAYARALLAVVEFLAGQATRPPAVATGIDASGRLERRFTRIVAPEKGLPMRRRRGTAMVGAASVLMFLGVGAATVPTTRPSPAAADVRPQVAGMRDDDALTPELGGIVPQDGDESAASTGDTEVWVPLEAVVIGSRHDDGDRTPPLRRRTVGSRGRDVLIGTRSSDLLSGRGGPDRLMGGPGDDILVGGPGEDILVGGRGADSIRGGRGDDHVIARHDGVTDTIDCGPGESDSAVIDEIDQVSGCEVVVIR